MVKKLLTVLLVCVALFAAYMNSVGATLIDKNYTCSYYEGNYLAVDAFHNGTGAEISFDGGTVSEGSSRADGGWSEGSGTYEAEFVVSDNSTLGYSGFSTLVQGQLGSAYEVAVSEFDVNVSDLLNGEDFFWAFTDSASRWCVGIDGDNANYVFTNDSAFNCNSGAWNRDTGVAIVEGSQTWRVKWDTTADVLTWWINDVVVANATAKDQGSASYIQFKDETNTVEIDEVKVWNYAVYGDLCPGWTNITPEASPPVVGDSSIVVELLSPVGGDADNVGVNGTSFVWRVNSSAAVDYCVFAANFTGGWVEQVVLNNSPDLVAAWTFDEDALDNLGGEYNGTVTGAILSESGQVGRAYLFDGVDDDISYGNVFDVNLSKEDGGASFAAWVKTTSDDEQNVYSKMWNTGSVSYGLQVQSNGIPRLWLRDTLGNSHWLDEGATAVNDGAWHFIAASIQNGSGYFCVDTSCRTETYPIQDLSNDRTFYIGRQSDGSDSKFNGSVDEFQVFNVSLSAAEVANIYEDSRYYLGAPKWVNVTTRVNSSALEGSWGWGVECFVGNVSSAVNDSFIVDWTAPTATLASNNFFQVSHQFIGDVGAEDARLNFTVADTVDVYAFEVWVLNGSGVVLNWTNTSLSGMSVVVERVKGSVNGSLAAGDYSVNLTVWDSHTDKVIGDFVVGKGVDYLDFDGLRITGVGAIAVDSVKQVDRYDFRFSYDKGGVKTYYVESEVGLTYVESAGFAAHFVDWELKRWVDFEGVGSVMSVKKLSDKKYEVVVGGVPSLAVFSSVGGLNSQVYEYTFTRTNVPVVSWAEPFGEFGVISVENTSFVNVSVSGTYLRNVTFHVYNGSYVFVRDYVVSLGGNGTVFYVETLENLTDADYYVNASVESVGGNEVGLGSVWLSRASLILCDEGNVSVRMRLRDENIPDYVLYGDVEVLGELTYGAGVSLVSVNRSGVNNVTLCLTPASTVGQLSAYVKYVSDYGFTHRYYFVNETVTNVSGTVYLYNYNYTAGVDDLKITARETESYNYFDKVYVKLQRRYVSEDVYRTVQMDKTGDYGTAIFHIREQDTDYRMLFYDEFGNLLKQTEDMKFKCDTDDLCDLTVVLDEWAAVGVADGLIVDMVYDNETGNITVSWSDDALVVSSVRMVVDRETLTGTLSICDESQVGAAGSMVCDVSAYSGVVGVRVYKTASPESAFRTWWVTIGQTRLGDFVGVENGALFTAAIMITAAGFGVAAPVIGVVVTVFALIVSYMFGLLGALTMTLVITASVMGILVGVLLRR